MAASIQTSQPDTLFHLTRELISLHQCHSAFHSEHLDIVESPEHLLVFERGEGAAKILCLFNLSSEEVEFQLPDSWDGAPILKQGGDIQTNIETGNHHFKAWSWRYISSHSDKA